MYNILIELLRPQDRCIKLGNPDIEDVKKLKEAYQNINMIAFNYHDLDENERNNLIEVFKKFYEINLEEETMVGGGRRTKKKKRKHKKKTKRKKKSK